MKTIKFNVGPPYWVRDLPVYAGNPAKSAARRKHKISLSLKFYLAEQAVREGERFCPALHCSDSEAVRAFYLSLSKHSLNINI